MPGLCHRLLSDQQLDQLQLEIAASFLVTAFFERIPHRYVEHDNGSGPMSCIAYFYHFHSASRAPPKSARWFLQTRAGRMQPLAERSWTAVSQTALYRSGHKLSRPLMQGRAREKRRQKKKCPLESAHGRARKGKRSHFAEIWHLKPPLEHTQPMPITPMSAVVPTFPDETHQSVRRGARGSVWSSFPRPLRMGRECERNAAFVGRGGRREPGGSGTGP